MTTEVAIIELPEAKELFDGSTIDRILENIEATARSYALDVTTESGRKEIASVAYKIAKSKVAIDEQGKELVAGIKRDAAKIDAERKKARDFLDALKAEIRQPLTDFENAEKERVANLERRVEAIRSAILEIPEGSAAIAEVIARIESVDPATFEEFATMAKAEQVRSLDRLNLAYEKAKKAEAEAAELERLRKEAEERERAEREERLKAEAAENARKEAEAKAAAEKKAAEEKAEAERLEIERKHQAELARQKAEAEAKERAIREEQEAAERKRKEEEAAKAAAEKAAAEAEAKRISDEKHRGRIHSEIIGALKSVGIETGAAQAALAAIATGKIPHVQISY